MLVCDPYILYQAFLNLIMNGIDAMEETGGILSISTFIIGDYVGVKIIDTGIGISQENMKKIFKDKFTTKEYGSGLGLNISKATIEDHGGNISIKSIENKGTEVNIYLPTYKGQDD